MMGNIFECGSRNMDMVDKFNTSRTNNYDTPKTSKYVTPKTSKYDTRLCCMNNYSVIDHEQSTSEINPNETKPITIEPITNKPITIEPSEIGSITIKPNDIEHCDTQKIFDDVKIISERKSSSDIITVPKKEPKLNITKNNFMHVKSIRPSNLNKKSDIKNGSRNADNDNTSIDVSDTLKLKSHHNNHNHNKYGYKSNQKLSPIIKILLVGNSKSGKTCFKNILTDRYVKHTYKPTNEITRATVTHIYQNARNIIEIYDTPGNVESINNIKDQISDFDCVIFFYHYGTTLNSLEPYDKSIFTSFDDILKLYVCNGHFKDFCQTGSYYMADLTNMNYCVEILKDVVKTLNHEIL
jgi:hypothetical protein